MRELISSKPCRFARTEDLLLSFLLKMNWKKDSKTQIMKRVIIITGPTASGKTELSIRIAKKLDGEIISADSMQIYREMNIGTAKPSKEEMQDYRII